MVNVMPNFEYVSKNEYLPNKKQIIELINLVQDEVRNEFTFRYDFIGSVERNMVTRAINSSVGYDFDVNLRVNDEEENYNAYEIKKIIMNGFNKYNHLFSYDYCEDSKRVITIKIKDKKNSRILHSCDFAVVHDCEDGRQQYIRFNKNHQSYCWEYQPKGFYQQNERVAALKNEGLWTDVRNVYLEKKNYNTDLNKKSRSIYAETINELYKQNFGDD